MPVPAAPLRAILVVAPLLAACAGTPKPAEPPPPQAAARPEAAEPEPFEACRMPVENQVPFVDETRRRLHETVCGAALWFDGLFGEGDIAAARSAYGRVELSYGGSEFYGRELRLRFHARVKLPALKERLSAFVGRDSDEDFVRDRTEGLALRSQFPRVDDQEEWLAGLGYALPEAHRFKLDFRVGARSLRRPKVFAQGRASYNAYSDHSSLVYFRLTPFVNNLDGFGATASADLSHALAATHLLRWGTIGTISEESPGLDWRSALILYQNLRARRAIAYETFVRGLTAAPEPLVEYGARAIYRHPLLDARLFGEAVVGYSWPRTDPVLDREGSFGASLGLEMPFGAAQ